MTRDGVQPRAWLRVTAERVDLAVRGKKRFLQQIFNVCARAGELEDHSPDERTVLAIQRPNIQGRGR